MCMLFASYGVGVSRRFTRSRTFTIMPSVATTIREFRRSSGTMRSVSSRAPITWEPGADGVRVVGRVEGRTGVGAIGCPGRMGAPPCAPSSSSTWLIWFISISARVYSSVKISMDVSRPGMSAWSRKANMRLMPSAVSVMISVFVGA